MSKIKILGLGGCGCNTVSNIKTLFNNIELSVINTDKDSLSNLEGIQTLQLGDGLGSGMNQSLALSLAQKQEEQIKEFIGNPEILVITAGAGGGTGGGIVNYIVDLAKSQNILTDVILTLPFNFENKTKEANKVLQELQTKDVSYKVIENQLLVPVAGDINIQKAYEISDYLTIRQIQAINNIAEIKGIQNIDFNDVKTIFSKSGRSFANTERGKTLIEALNRSVETDLFTLEAETIEGALVNIRAKELPTLREIENILTPLKHKLLTNGILKFGFAQQNFDKENEAFRVDIILTGLNKKQDHSEFVSNFQNDKISQIRKNAKNSNK